MLETQTDLFWESLEMAQSQETLGGFNGNAQLGNGLTAQQILSPSLLGNDPTLPSFAIPKEEQDILTPVNLFTVFNERPQPLLAASLDQSRPVERVPSPTPFTDLESQDSFKDMVDWEPDDLKLSPSPPPAKTLTLPPGNIIKRKRSDSDLDPKDEPDNPEPAARKSPKLENNDNSILPELPLRIGRDFSLPSGIRPGFRRQIKPIPTSRELTPREESLLNAREKKPSGIFQGYFPNSESANEELTVMLSLYDRPVSACTFPETDKTFPTTPEEQVLLVRQIFDAIMDWSDYKEWTQAVDLKTRESFIQEIMEKRIKDGMDLTDVEDVPLSRLDIRREELQAILPPLETQQKKVLSRDLNDQTAEFLSWSLMVSTFCVLQYC